MASCSVVLLSCSEPISRHTLLEVLAEHGCRPVIFAAVGDVREHLRERAAALIVCPSELLDGGFRDVLDVVQDSGRRVPVVVVSHRDDTDEYIAAMQSGAFDFLTLPVRRAEAEWVLHNALHRTLAAAG